MLRFTLFAFLYGTFLFASAQVVNTGMTDEMDTAEAGKISISGYIDTYYGFDFNQPQTFDRPYCVSSSRHNEININLAYIDLKYRNDRVRARFVPGFGTYMNANYVNEKGSLKNIVEANVGIKLFKNKEIWVDAGVMGSPITNESAISKDHFTYTRSLGIEYVPYYLTGVKLTLPISKKFISYFYVVNGWQEISDVNNPLSVATQIEYRPNNKILINWNTYFGDEQSVFAPQDRMRYFTDIYMIYDISKKISMNACAYIGLQNRKDSLGNSSQATWWQANVNAKYKFDKNVSLAGRIEYFDDPRQVQITPITNVYGFNSYSTSLCLNVKITNNAMFRVEGRNYFSNKQVYIDANKNPSTTSDLLITNITVWF